ncbi:MAG: caspase family protein [SAR324 cluster bacterium]|nr:caspase family protein [SAR324 cluster bacterium]
MVRELLQRQRVLRQQVRQLLCALRSRWEVRRHSKNLSPPQQGGIMVKTLFIFLFIFLIAPPIFASKRGISRVEIKTQSGEEVGLYEESHALVIGVSDYTAGWPRLGGVREDVREVRQALEDNGFAVILVENPDRMEFEGAVRQFIVKHGRKENNRLLFYYAGHGFTQKLGYGGDMGYLVPRDAPDPNRDPEGFELNAISMQNIETYARTIGAKHALFVFDACFAGSIFNVTRAIPKNIELKTAKPVRQFITSGSAEQEVPDKSIFRIEFVRALRGDGDLNEDGFMTASELGQHLETKVVEYRGEQQTPQYGKLNDPLLNQGDFVFKMPGKAKPPARASVSKPKASEEPAPKRFRPDEEMWDLVKDSQDPGNFEFFIESFPESKLSRVAKLKLKLIQRKNQKSEKVESSKKTAVLKTFDDVQMQRDYKALKSSKSKLAHKNFIKKYEKEPEAENQVATIRNRLKMLEDEPAIWTDPQNSLIWQKKKNPVRSTFPEAVSYCTNLVWEGNRDWRLASPKEWASASKKNEFKSKLIQSSQSYWTSKKRNFNQAFYFYGSTQLVFSGSTKLNQRVLCVQGKGFDIAQMQRDYNSLQSNKSILAHKAFIRNYKNDPQAENQVATIRNRLRMLEQKNSSNSSAAGSGYTKRQAYLDFLEAKGSKLEEAYRQFIKKHSGTPGAQSYLQRARKELKELEDQVSSRDQIKAAFNRAVRKNTVDAYQSFINKYQNQTEGKFYVKSAKRNLKNLQGTGSSSTPSSSNSGYTKREAYLDFLEAKGKNRASALRKFIRKHSDTPGAGKYLMQARQQLLKLE